MDAISTIFTADNANYFLLEGQHALPQFAERIYNKPQKVQEKFFQVRSQTHFFLFFFFIVVH